MSEFQTNFDHEVCTCLGKIVRPRFFNAILIPVAAIPIAFINLIENIIYKDLKLQTFYFPYLRFVIKPDIIDKIRINHTFRAHSVVNILFTHKLAYEMQFCSLIDLKPEITCGYY